MQKIKTTKLYKAIKLARFCKFDFIAQSSSELVTWFDCRMLTAVRLIQISNIDLLDLKDKTSSVIRQEFYLSYEFM